MLWVGNDRSGLVHTEDCEYAQKILLGRVEFEELYHALSEGYEEAGCCLTDAPRALVEAASVRQKISRMRVIGAGGCGVCGESRCVQLAHIIPRTMGGALTIPLCPTHHKAYDEGCLTPEELENLSHYAARRITPSTGGKIIKMHGAVRRARKGNQCDQKEP